MNSRNKGNGFERVIARRLRAEVWSDCATTRFKGSPWLDASGVDLVNTPGYNIQLKALERVPAYHTILNCMPKDGNTNLIIHKRNNQGCIAVMRLDDFLTLLKNKNNAGAAVKY